ncbi:carboxymuconolactone decarboxylase family protein [Desulfosporosinus sp. OT]|uniref:carboxymuconolactone decarboxylase family protein n=1 Tax=Desulfosporosinus sp. OT TaxID=913865 RepID=UPI00030E0AF6|nr:carboxymuconolactone decarboxylase family protein [Desulfosporosinus sp. OT]
MKAFIAPPAKIPFYLKIGIWISKRVTGKDLLPPKLLAWYPKTAISSGILESLVANGKKDLDKRILKLVRVQSSFAVSCPFCVDMNSFEFEKVGITEVEMSSIQRLIDINQVQTFSIREKIAMEYASCISKSPISIPSTLVQELKKNFSEREIVILAATVAQVNYWARLLQGLGVPPAGFSDKCNLKSFSSDTASF